SSAIAVLRNLDQVANLVQHPPQLRRIHPLHAMTNPAETQRPQRVPLAPIRPIARPPLGDHYRAHDETSAGSSAAGPASASPRVCCPSPPFASPASGAPGADSVVSPRT